MRAVWSLKAGKKCRKLYLQALEKASEQLQAINDANQRIKQILVSKPDNSPDQESQRKKRKFEKAAADGAASVDTVAKIAPGTSIAAKIFKEGVPVWILATVLGFNAQKGAYDCEDAETDRDSPDYKRRFSLQPSSTVTLPDLKKPPRVYASGTYVLALYPDTSCFYKAKVVECPSTSRDPYVVQFEEDDDQLRSISAGFVV
eukprot:Partr_v1_DN25319_c0_g1_i9_m21891